MRCTRKILNLSTRFFNVKNTLLFIVVMSVFACSSNDDNGPSINLELLYGQWYRVGLCQEQNSLLLNSDGTYVSFSSGAVDCNDPEPDTYKSTGTYSVNGVFYSAEELTRELIIDGTLTTDFDFPNPNIRTEIKDLTAESFTFRSYIDLGNNVIEELGQFNYER